MNDDLKKLLENLSGKVDNLAREVGGVKQITQNLEKTTQNLVKTSQNLGIGFIKLQHQIADLPTRDEFDQFKDNVYNKMDAAYKEVLAMRQEQSAHSLQHEDINKRLDNLESPTAVAH